MRGNPGQSHYLTCLDSECEYYVCVARRDYENQILCLKAQVKELTRSIKLIRKTLYPENKVDKDQKMSKDLLCPMHLKKECACG